MSKFSFPRSIFMLIGTVVFVAFFLFLPHKNFTATSAIGTEEIEFTIPGTDRTLVAEIFYPTDEVIDTHDVLYDFIWLRRNFKHNATLSAKKDAYPLIIFSHGNHGDRFGSSWIAEALVDNGYIAVMLDHAHSTSYDYSYEFLYTALWQRPLDITATLNYLLAHTIWSSFIDQEKIAVGGFSLGGTSALWLTGIAADEILLKNALQVHARFDMWPQSSKNRALSIDWSQASRSYYDQRIKAVFAFAPDLGNAFTKEGIAQAKVPVFLVVGDKDNITPAQENALFYAAHLPHAIHVEVLKNVGHYTFLNRSIDLRPGHPMASLCTDSFHVNRGKIHQTLALKVVEFLETVFKKRQNADFS